MYDVKCGSSVAIVSRVTIPKYRSDISHLQPITLSTILPRIPLLLVKFNSCYYYYVYREGNEQNKECARSTA